MSIDRERLAFIANRSSAYPMEMVKAVLTDITAQGYVIVPREATEAMMIGGGRAICGNNFLKDGPDDPDDGWDCAPPEYRASYRNEAMLAWSAMIAASEG